jgi:hypothetical protein
MAGYRVFLSHPWTDQSPVRTAENPRRALAAGLRDHLRAQGFNVLYDEEAIEGLDDITERIEQGLAGSPPLVCWYSDWYRGSRAYDRELTTAVTCDTDRIVVVSPEPHVDHILPAALRNRLIPSVPDLR